MSGTTFSPVIPAAVIVMRRKERGATKAPRTRVFVIV
jgi:hypothetical protein